MRLAKWSYSTPFLGAWQILLYCAPRIPSKVYCMTVIAEIFQIHVDVPRVCRRRASSRPAFTGTRLRTNADMGPAEARQFCQLDEASQRLMRAAMRQLHLSARAYHRVLKLARTIADLASAPEIGPAHLAEAIQYRPRRVE
jgi:predicted ATPase with chaperone activity